jgi:hypothetical protein
LVDTDKAENKGSSQPKNGKNGKSKAKKNKNVKRTIIKIIGFCLGSCNLDSVNAGAFHA